MMLSLILVITLAGVGNTVWAQGISGVPMDPETAPEAIVQSGKNTSVVSAQNQFQPGVFPSFTVALSVTHKVPASTKKLLVVEVSMQCETVGGRPVGMAVRVGGPAGVIAEPMLEIGGIPGNFVTAWDGGQNFQTRGGTFFLRPADFGLSGNLPVELLVTQGTQNVFVSSCGSRGMVVHTEKF